MGRGGGGSGVRCELPPVLFAIASVIVSSSPTFTSAAATRFRGSAANTPATRRRAPRTPAAAWSTAAPSAGTTAGTRAPGCVRGGPPCLWLPRGQRCCRAHYCCPVDARGAARRSAASGNRVLHRGCLRHWWRQRMRQQSWRHGGGRLSPGRPCCAARQSPAWMVFSGATPLAPAAVGANRPKTILLLLLLPGYRQRCRAQPATRARVAAVAVIAWVAVAGQRRHRWLSIFGAIRAKRYRAVVASAARHLVMCASILALEGHQVLGHVVASWQQHQASRHFGPAL